MYVDGGGGVGDKINVAADDVCEDQRRRAISLNFSKIEIDYNQFTDLGLIGGTKDSNDRHQRLHRALKLSLDGGGGIDSIKFSTGESLVKITDSSIAPGALNPMTTRDSNP